jgi:serine/threonine protein kinase
MTDNEFATVVRGLPLTTGQAATAGEVFAAPGTKELPDELIRRAVLTEYQARQILAGNAVELTVARYVILDELGRGGMGAVFRARDTAMDRLVALKLIRADRLANEAAVLRFQQEVRAAARLAHPNIVRAYDAGTDRGRHFLVTELVTGSDLGRELSRRGAFPAGEACECARQAAVGLQHAFEQGLTHRDVKPSNLLFSATERLVKIADFGLARLADAGSGGLTAAGAVFGTPDYIAPEQASSAAQADIRSDLYSLGCTLYHFLTGRVPFPTDSAAAKLVAHATTEPEPLEDSSPGLSPALVAVVRKLMAKNPADRYQTPHEAADALLPFCPKSKLTTTAALTPASADPTGATPPTHASASTLGSTPPVSPVPDPAAERPARKRIIKLTIGCTIQTLGAILVVVAALTTLGSNASSTFSFVGSTIRPSQGSPTPGPPTK